MRQNHLFWGGVAPNTVALLVVLFISGCATGTNLLLPYPVQQKNKLDLLRQGLPTPEPPQAKGFLRPNSLLNNLEEGRIQQIQGNTEKSIEYYGAAIDQFDKQNSQALIDASALTASGAALVVNDNVRSYEGALFERTLLHLFQAQNYLFQGNLEAAAVEARRMNVVDKNLLEATRKKRAKAQERDKKSDLAIDDASDALGDRQQQLNAEALKVKHDYFNAYAYFTSALIYEKSGAYNDAYIDYQKALEFAPDNTVVRDSMIRAALRSGLRDQLKYTADEIEQSQYSKRDPEIIVLFEQGLVPPMREFSFAVQKLDGGLVSVSLPGYFEFKDYFTPLSIEYGVQGSRLTWQTEPLMNLQPIIAKSLKDKQPEILLRQALRVAAKNNFQNNMNDNHGALGGIVASLYNVISERADLRSWLSLPVNYELARHFVAPGGQQLEFSLGAATVSQAVNVNLQRGDTLLIRCIAIEDQLYVEHTKI